MTAKSTSCLRMAASRSLERANALPTAGTPATDVTCCANRLMKLKRSEPDWKGAFGA